MSNTERKRVLNYRNGNGLAPNPDNIDYGEIAIGYKTDNEAIYIKNTANNIVDFTPISIVNITYNELKNLRDNSKLKPSQYYRITDFVTTVANDPEAQSAGHQFDIIVLASDKNKLQEECYAIQHEGDKYFANCNLAAWKIWYCLDNDTTKYAWADTTKDGKGVIYRMIDEWQNDCPYDFKNVQFKRYAVADITSNGALADLDGTYIGYNSDMTGLNIPNKSDFRWAYTFSLPKENEYVDYSSNGLYGPFTKDLGYFNLTKKGQCVYNALSNTYGSVNIDGQFYVSLILNNIVLISQRTTLTDTDDFPSEMVYNTFGTANFNMTLKDNPESNKFDDRCYNNIVSGYANTFGNGCIGNTFGNNCSDNSFGNSCYSNSFGYGCSRNSFGNGCIGNTFGNDYCDNSFGNNCGGNSFGNSCYSNSFGYGCDNNSFGNVYCNNSFGNNCSRNTFGNNCDSNKFEDRCGGNTFRDNCSCNSFGDECTSNTFGNRCVGNTFGSGCDSNTFGDRCVGNTFGNGCIGNTFGNYFQYNALGNDIQYIEIPTEQIHHTQILNGTRGTQDNKLTLEFMPGTIYSQFAGFTPDGVLKIWVEDDVVDGGSY